MKKGKTMEYNSAGLPKVLHYCWFGRGEKSPLIQKCIASWREKMPDWEIREWNEDSFDVNSCPYTAEAYAAKKYAFVADYARFWILYHVGGVCLCTDVEIFKSYAPLLEKTPSVMGFELVNTVNPGSIMSALPGDELIAEVMKDYESRHFLVGGKPDTTTIVTYTTNMLKRHGFTGGDKLQQVGNITIYPGEYFSPFDHETQMFLQTENTYSVHHYAATWSPWYRKLRFRCIGLAARVLGRERYLRWKRKIKPVK